MAAQHRKFWGWGVAEMDLDGPAKEKLAKTMCERFGLSGLEPQAPPTVEELELRDPRVKPPKVLEGICSTDAEDRAGHTYGKSIRDVIRAFHRDFSNPPDFVAFPRDEGDVTALLDWCTDMRVAAIPYGGGSSVVGGVEAPAEGDYGGYKGAVSIDLKHLNKVMEVDEISRAANIQAGTYGPQLEEQLRPHGLTLRHYPQSFEFSTLGGWIATRSGGHYATLYTHIDDFVESTRTVTPQGTMESRRLPGSGAGPSPDRLMIGSEGILGIITSAWMRLQHRPTFRANASVHFSDFMAAAQAVRAISQAGLYPANVRILDPTQALLSDAGDGSQAIMVLGFESADHELDVWMKRALECCKDHGGSFDDAAAGSTQDESVTKKGAAGAWRSNFIYAPYIGNALTSMGIISSTFETSITWERWPDFHRQVMKATQKAVNEICGQGLVACRFTHAYPDGPAPYYSILAPAKMESMMQQWEDVRAAASDVLMSLGGTITHHHAVGRDHRPWYDKQRPDNFALALGAAKKALDPAGILNPGVLIDPA